MYPISFFCVHFPHPRPPCIFFFQFLLKNSNHIYLKLKNDEEKKKEESINREKKTHYAVPTFDDLLTCFHRFK